MSNIDISTFYQFNFKIETFHHHWRTLIYLSDDSKCQTLISVLPSEITLIIIDPVCDDKGFTSNNLYCQKTKHSHFIPRQCSGVKQI